MMTVEALTRTLMKLLVDGDFESVERTTLGKDMEAATMRSIMSEYGASFREANKDWWSTDWIHSINRNDGKVLRIDAPLWAVEENGRSDLTSQLRLCELDGLGVCRPEIMDMHVL
jgi:hypothetical protein